MWGADVDTLNVFLEQYDSNMLKVVNRMLIWKKYGTSARKWYEVKKTFTSDKPWKITFEGIVGKTFLADIAVDDVAVLSGITKFDQENDYPYSD